MTFDELIATYSTGFALNRLNELRLAATGINPTKRERKQLASLIEYARTRGRVGRVANLLIIGLVTNTDYWLEWIKMIRRHSPALGVRFGHGDSTETPCDLKGNRQQLQRAGFLYGFPG